MTVLVAVEASGPSFVRNLDLTHTAFKYLVWWSSDKTYKNAITNELFLYTSAVGYLRTQNQTYLDNAKKVSSLFHTRAAALTYI